MFIFHHKNITTDALFLSLNHTQTTTKGNQNGPKAVKSDSSCHGGLQFKTKSGLLGQSVKAKITQSIFLDENGVGVCVDHVYIMDGRLKGMLDQVNMVTAVNDCVGETKS